MNSNSLKLSENNEETNITNRRQEENRAKGFVCEFFHKDELALNCIVVKNTAFVFVRHRNGYGVLPYHLLGHLVRGSKSYLEVAGCRSACWQGDNIGIIDMGRVLKYVERDGVDKTMKKRYKRLARILGQPMEDMSMLVDRIEKPMSRLEVMISMFKEAAIHHPELLN